MQSKDHNIHDTYFKYCFSRERIVRDFLLHNLPPEVLARVDITTLRLEPNELLPSRYRSQRRADLIYSVRDKEGEKVYAVLHLEGQSKHDANMALRVWEYHVAIAGAHFQQGSKKLPLILTFVLYHGKAPWSSAKCIADLFEDLDLYIKLSLKSPFLINLTEAKMESLAIQNAAAAPQMIMKMSARGDFCNAFGRLYPLIEKPEQEKGVHLEYIMTLERYDIATLLKKLSNFDPETADNLKTMFEAALEKERIRARNIGIVEGEKRGMMEGEKRGMMQGMMEGEKRGMMKGILEGEKRGMMEGEKRGMMQGKLAIAKQMLADGAPSSKIVQYTGLALSEITKLS